MSYRPVPARTASVRGVLPKAHCGAIAVCGGLRRVDEGAKRRAREHVGALQRVAWSVGNHDTRPHAPRDITR